MGAIAGIYNSRQQLVDKALLEKMLDLLAHRGKDGANIWRDRNIGLLHRMLWTTPESLHETLPLEDGATGLVITADARLDNREELFSHLVFGDRKVESLTDSEMILASYLKWGVKCPQYLLGDFAFVIWDSQNQSLFCARDHFGIKPFYYYSSEQIFTFATEIKAILSHPDVPQQIDETRLAGYMIGDFDDLELTSYQEIKRLPPAHYLVVNSEGVQINRYWSLDLNRQTILESDEAYAKEFQRLFTEAVKCRLRSAFPLGANLSGGLDSSSVSCVARNILQETSEPKLLNTFSAVFDRVRECDEREYINEVLAQGGFQPHYLLGDSRTPLSDLQDIFWYQDEAFFAPGFAIMSWGLCGLAKDQGVRILLEGHDGDSTVSHGFGYLHDLAKAGRWLAFYREAKGVAKIYNESVWQGFWNYFQAYAIKTTIAKSKPLRFLSKVFRKLKAIVQKPQLVSSKPNFGDDFNPDFAARVNLQQRYETWLKNEFASKTSSRQEHYRILTQGLHALALEIEDKAASAFGLEIRYPFWDKRLVEFCFSLPPEQKLSQGWTRAVMRRAMTGILPTKVQWRTSKMDFTPNFKQGLLIQEKQCLETLLYQESKKLEKYLDLDKLRQKYEQGNDLQFIWRAVSLGLWLNHIETNQAHENLVTSGV